MAARSWAPMPGRMRPPQRQPRGPRLAGARCLTIDLCVVVLEDAPSGAAPGMAFTAARSRPPLPGRIRPPPEAVSGAMVLAGARCLTADLCVAVLEDAQALAWAAPGIAFTAARLWPRCQGGCVLPRGSLGAPSWLAPAQDT
ncbi:hypothetical protein PG984_013639 [Apiospora sp. TS-2023a]